MTTRRSALRVALAHGGYLLLIHLACLVALAPFAVRVLRDRRQWRWVLARLGRLPPGAPAGRPVWVHAVSVGEVKASRELVRRLGVASGAPVVLSTGTVTGLETARQLLPDTYVFPWPLDLPWVVAGVLRRIDPRLLVTVELEVWPGLMRQADARGIPQAIVNGRVSRSSFRTYRRLSWLLPEFDRLALVAAQTDEYADRIRQLGVPAERVLTTGNLKHDLTTPAPAQAVARLARELGLDGAGPPVLVAGSTHEGEDGPVVEAWRAAGDSRLVLVPRHLDRVPDIARLLKRLEVPFRLRSQGTGSLPAGEVLLVDSMGELELLFGLADVVFLGGSLVPVGGHNVLEPAAAGCPVLTGPWRESCQAESDALERAGALEVVPDGRALSRALARLLADPALRRRRGRAAVTATRRLAGATERTLAALADHGLLPRA